MKLDSDGHGTAKIFQKASLDSVDPFIHASLETIANRISSNNSESRESKFEIVTRKTKRRTNRKTEDTHTHAQIHLRCVQRRGAEEESECEEGLSPI